MTLNCGCRKAVASDKDISGVASILVPIIRGNPKNFPPENQPTAPQLAQVFKESLALVRNAAHHHSYFLRQPIIHPIPPPDFSTPMYQLAETLMTRYLRWAIGPAHETRPYNTLLSSPDHVLDSVLIFACHDQTWWRNKEIYADQLFPITELIARSDFHFSKEDPLQFVQSFIMHIRVSMEFNFSKDKFPPLNERGHLWLAELILRCSGISCSSFSRILPHYYPSTLLQETARNLRLLGDAAVSQSEHWKNDTLHNSEDRVDPCRDLLNVLYRHHFLRSLPPPTSSFPDPMLDCLLEVINNGYEGDAAWYHASNGPVSFLLASYLMRYNVHSPTWHPTAFILVFTIIASRIWSVKELQLPDPARNIQDIKDWESHSFLRSHRADDREKAEREGLERMSPLPWSAKARRHGIPPPIERPSAVSPPSAIIFHYDHEGKVRLLDIPRVPEWTCHFKIDTTLCPEIPWLGGPHTGYPWSSSLGAYTWVRRGAIRTRRDTVAVWQGAMIFGVLEVICDMPIPERLVRKNAKGATVVNPSVVSALMTDWALRMLELGQNNAQRDVWVSRVKDTMEWASGSLNEVATAPLLGKPGFFDNTGLGKDEVNEIISSLSAFYSQLGLLILEVLRPDEDIMWTFNSVNCLSGGTADEPQVSSMAAAHYSKEMVAVGWCPWFVAQITIAGWPPGILIRASKRPPHYHTRHDHSHCTEARCAAHHIDSVTYVTQHHDAVEDCACDFISPPVEDIAQFLSTGHIPVVVLEDGHLNVYDAEDVKYVAISHVWADGLGSTTECGLPICQIQRIDAYVRQLLPEGPPAFWIDGLCVPAKKDLRRKAIGIMGNIYKQATHVLVIDSTLRDLSLSTEDFEEVAFRIQVSPWMQRVWTLQEAVLAKELHFVLGDGLASLLRLNQTHIYRVKYPGIKTLVTGFDPIPDHLLNMSPLSLNMREPPFNLPEVVTAVGTRASTKKEDVIPAIASLLGVDTAILLAEPNEESRMKRLFMELENIPADILFYPAPRRFPDPPFRWAPTSIDGIGAPVTFLGNATLTPTGLKVEQKLILIRVPRITVETLEVMGVFVEELHTKTFYRVSLPRLQKGERITFNALLVPPRLDPNDDPLEPLCKDVMSGMSVVGVNVSTDAELQSRTENLTSGPEEPVLCGYEKRLAMMNLTPFRSSIMYKIDRGFYPNIVVVKGEASSVEVIVS